MSNIPINRGNSKQVNRNVWLWLPRLLSLFALSPCTLICTLGHIDLRCFKFWLKIKNCQIVCTTYYHSQFDYFNSNLLWLDWESKIKHTLVLSSSGDCSLCCCVSYYQQTDQNDKYQGDLNFGQQAKYWFDNG